MNSSFREAVSLKITPKAIGFAIHGPLSALRIGQGCSLSLRELAADWAETSLRKTDLGVGLEALRMAGHLSLEHTPQGPMIRLLDEQFGMIRTEHDRQAVATLRHLRETRRRPQSHLAALIKTPRSGRRQGESGPQTLQ